MTEKFRFMDPVQLEDGTYDREYNAQEFTDYFKALVTTGVMKSVGGQLMVSANGSNMVTRIDTGISFILGRYYENDSFKELTHDTESLGNSRIDRVVIRMDLSPDKRHVLAFVKKGAPSPNPVPPTLTQTQIIYEISLAQVRVVGGQTFIAANAVTDERGTSVICPWVGSNILPSFDDNMLAQHINDNSKHLQSGERVSWNSKQDGFKYYGSLKDLNEIKDVGDYASAYFINKPDGLYEYALLSLRVEKYSTDWVRQVITYFDESATAYRQWERAYTAGTAWSSWREISYSKLFTSVSNGKATVNQAVTDMGVYTAPDASFATTAANIRNLSNIVPGTGTITNNGTQTFFNVTGLSFKPRAYMFRTKGGNIPGSWGVHNSTFSASEFVVVINHSSYGNVSSVFDGGFTVAAAYPNGTGQFDWWAIK